MRESKAPSASHEQFSEFVHRQATQSRAQVPPPATPQGWGRRLDQVRAGLQESFGRALGPPCPLEPEILGLISRPGYVIERLTFQSRPGVRVTANLYRPESLPKPVPGVLSVHGHWPWARIDPVVQARCIGLAKLGYVCLCVDAFGSGERAVEPGPGTYHGGLLGASLWPAGVPLLGLQVHDNRRAVDYLQSRPEVDPGRMAITGASGGGNQTLYAGATDDRLKAVVPVCGIGTFESYLTTACCVCEVNDGALRYATTGDLLAMVAPRALLVISATRDSLQFSVAQAARSVAYARERYRLLDQEDRLRHLAIDSGHDYSKPMREAMYGWLDRWLKGEGRGDPVPEPEVKPEEPQSLRCYPDGQSRPAAIVTIPQFAHVEGLARLAALPPPPDHRQRWDAEAILMRQRLRDLVLGGFPSPIAPAVCTSRPGEGASCQVEMAPEEGLRLRCEIQPAARRGRASTRPRGTVILIEAGESLAEGTRALADSWRQAGFATAEVGLRANGRGKPQTHPVAGVLDHDEAEWGIWLGRPLLGQWTWDLLRWIEVLDGLRGDPASLSGPLILAARGSMSLVALIAGAFSPRVHSVVVDDCPVSFVPPTPRVWSGIAMGTVAPKFLEVADIAHVVALVAPRRLIVVKGVEVDGTVAEEARMREAFRFARSIYGLLGSDKALTLGHAGDVPAAV